MISVNGNTLTYDDVGNVLTYGGRNFTWENGRNLKTVTEQGNICSYTYDEESDTYTIIKNEGLVDLRRKVVVTFTFTPPEKEELKVSFDLSLRPF